VIAARFAAAAFERRHKDTKNSANAICTPKVTPKSRITAPRLASIQGDWACPKQTSHAQVV
jgi:hypothetical protein